MNERLKNAFDDKRNAYAVWRDTMDKASAEGRSLTEEENTIVNRCEADIDAANRIIEDEKNNERRRQKLAETALQLEEAVRAPLSHIQREAAKPVDNRPIGVKLKAMLEGGMTRSEALTELSKQRDDERTKAFNAFLLGNYAALQKDNDSTGGFLLAPEQFIARLIQDLDNAIWFRQKATIIPVVGAEGIGVPTLETDIGDPTWTTELSVGTEDSSMVFGKRKLTPHPLARYIKVSKDLLRSSALSVEAIVRERLAFKFAAIQETAFMTGSGAGSPLGIFTASDNGVSTSQDESTDNTTTAFTVDGLINAKYKLTPSWLNAGNLIWIFHQDAVKLARKLKDGDGRYIWEPGMVADRTDTILGVPVMVSQYAPNTFTTLLYVGCICNPSYYWIAENMSLDIQRLQELGALTNQDYFIGRVALDGMPVWEKAFVRVKLG